MEGKVFLLGVVLATSWLVATVDAQVFSVALTQTQRGDSPIIVPFDRVMYNDGSYNETTHSFVCTVPGIYYFSFSAGLETGRGALMSLMRNGIFTVEVRNDDTHSNGIGLASRGVFTNVQQGTIMTVVGVLDEFRSLHGDPFTQQTTWNAFRYNDLAETDIAFSVARTTNVSESMDPLLFETELLNIGIPQPPFNMTTGMFVVQLPGVYFFQISAGAREEREVRLNITKNDEDIQIASLYRTQRNHNGVDTMSRTLLVDLSLGDEVHIVNEYGSQLYSDSGYQTSFSGFLYASAAQAGSAFMAYRSQSWQFPVVETPLHYDMVDVNKGPGFNETISVFTCVIPGHYFFSLTAGAMPDFPVSISLRLNYGEILRVEDRSTLHNGIDTFSRDVITDLYFGDVIHVEADGGTGLFSDIGRQTSFLGFRIR